jgi:hypothetical protein
VPYSQVKIGRVRDTSCLHNQSDHCPDDGGSTHLWNVSLIRRDYTALYPRRLYLHTRRCENLKSHGIKSLFYLSRYMMFSVFLPEILTSLIVSSCSFMRYIYLEVHNIINIWYAVSLFCYLLDCLILYLGILLRVCYWIVCFLPKLFISYFLFLFLFHGLCSLLLYWKYSF